MSQTTVQGAFLANNSVTRIKVLDRSLSGTELANNLTISSNVVFQGSNTHIKSANTTLSGSNTFISGSQLRVVSANTLFSSNVNFANTIGNVKPVINFASANVQGLPAGGAQPGETTVFTAAQRFATVGFTAGSNTGTSTVTLNLANNNYFDITLANNIVMANPTGTSNTQGGSIFMTQDGTGNRTVTFGQYWRFPSGSAPSLSSSANAQDRIDYVVKSANSIHASVTLDLLGT